MCNALCAAFELHEAGATKAAEDTVVTEVAAHQVHASNKAIVLSIVNTLALIKKNFTNKVALLHPFLHFLL